MDGQGILQTVLRFGYGVRLQNKHKLPKDVHHLVDNIIEELTEHFEDDEVNASIARLANILKNAHKDHSMLLANVGRAAASLKLKERIY